MKVNKACDKAIELCQYILTNSTDRFITDEISREKINIHTHLIDNNPSEAIKSATNVARFVRDHYDSLMGQNYLMEIESHLGPNDDSGYTGGSFY